MSDAPRKRLAKLMVRLTPQQAVLHYIEEAHRYPSFVAWAQHVAGLSDGAHPLAQLREQVREPVRQALKGCDLRDITRHERQATKDADFLQRLHQDTNVKWLDSEPQRRLQLLLLFEQIRSLLHLLSAHEQAIALHRRLSQALPYPLDRETGAAITAAIGNAVETWEALTDLETVQSWVLGAYLTEGKTAVPDWAALARDDPDGTRYRHIRYPEPETVRACFADEVSYAAFQAGTDFSYGLADVPDVDFLARCAAVEAALHDLIASGAVTEGRVVRLESVPLSFLQEAPLVEGVWLDRTALELAEWGATLAKQGFTMSHADEDNPFAWHPFGDRDADVSPQADQPSPAAMALRQAARTHLAGFKGRTHLIAGRAYLHLDDYRAWRGRRVKDDLQAATKTGLHLGSWSAWVEAHGGEGVACLAGVPVERLSCWASGANISVHDAGEAARRLAERARLLTDARSGCLTDANAADEAYSKALPLGRASFRDQARVCQRHAASLLAELYGLVDTVEAASQRYLAGHEVLFADAAQGLVTFIDHAEQAVNLFNEAIAAEIDDADARAGEATSADSEPPYRIDVTGLRAGTGPLVRLALGFLVDLAKAKTLDDHGEREAGHRIMAQWLTS